MKTLLRNDALHINKQHKDFPSFSFILDLFFVPSSEIVSSHPKIILNPLPPHLVQSSKERILFAHQQKHKSQAYNKFMHWNALNLKIIRMKNVSKCENFSWCGVCGLGNETLAKTSRINSIKMLQRRERARQGDTFAIFQRHEKENLSPKSQVATNKSKTVPMTFVGAEFLDEKLVSISTWPLVNFIPIQCFSMKKNEVITVNCIRRCTE